jgi:FkbM family methyltransferase
LGIQASRFYPSTYEPEKADFLRRYCEPASTVVDVGAHFGVFTVIMARAVGSRGMVVAFEPTPSTRAALHKTVTNNRCQSVVTIRPEAVSTDDGELDFIASEHAGDMGNSLIAHAFGASDRVRVPTVRLDSVLQADHVTCLKIDAEGAEFDILRGAAAILQNQRPAVTVEIHPWALEQHGQHPRDIWNLLSDLNYRVHRDGQELTESTFLAESGYFDVQATPVL